jgi:hypothetical protein
MTLAISVARWLLAVIYAAAGFVYGAVERVRYMVHNWR